MLGLPVANWLESFVMVLYGQQLIRQAVLDANRRRLRQRRDRTRPAQDSAGLTGWAPR